MSSEIFLSYARENQSASLEFEHWLSCHGFRVWVDRSLTPGERWIEQLEDRLDRCHAALVLWSHSAITSEWVRREARYARRKNKLVCVRIEPCNPPFEFDDVHAPLLYLSSSSLQDDEQKRQLLHSLRSTRTPNEEISPHANSGELELRIARMHLTGAGAPKSDSLATRWLNESANKGNQTAKSILNEMKS